MNISNSNHPKPTKQSLIKFPLLGASQDPSLTAEVPSAAVPQSTLQSLSRAFNASVPIDSGSQPVKSRGTKSHRKQSKNISHNSTTLRMSRLQRPAIDLNTPLSKPLGKFASAAARQGKSAPQKKVRANGVSFEEVQASITMRMLGHDNVIFYYKASFEGKEVMKELDFENEVQRLQIKFAAYRCSWNKPDKQILADGPIVPLVTFQSLRSPADNSLIGFKVYFDLQESLSPDLDTNVILRKLGAPTGADIIQFSKTEAFDTVEQIFKIEGFTRSRFDEVFGSSDLPPACTDMCASVYKDFGPITLPLITLNDFGNFCVSLKRHGREVALATLQRCLQEVSAAIVTSRK